MNFETVKSIGENMKIRPFQRSILVHFKPVPDKQNTKTPYLMSSAEDGELNPLISSVRVKFYKNIDVYANPISGFLLCRIMDQYNNSYIGK